MLVSIIFISSFVSLASAAFQDDINKFASGFGEATRFFLGDVVASGQDAGAVLFVKLLVFILILSVVNTTIRRIPQLGDNKTIAIIISIAVALIGVRYITTSQLVNFIWLPYGTLTIALSVLLPFIIGFFFIEGFDSFIIRKLGWSSFLVIFLGLAYMRWDDLQPAGGGFNLAWWYVGIAIVSGLLIIFDRNIRAYMLESSLSNITDVNKRVQAAQITHDIQNEQKLLATTTNPQARDAIIKSIEAKRKTIKTLLKT